eukprot:scaffold2315_cov113-Cylindrotheca_fusiformis.AAC.11
MIHGNSLFLRLLLFLLLSTIHGLVQRPIKNSIFTTTNQNLDHRNQVEVHPIATQQDVLDLADLRFQEWIQHNDSNNNNNENGRKPPPPSQYAFRMATAEITDERIQAGAVSFLAKMATTNQRNNELLVVGSAELSPIEISAAMMSSSDETNFTSLYVTDVVTSSNHRRMGVGSAIMDALECHAIEKSNCSRIYLHVSPSNNGALEFYKKRGYSQVTDDAGQLLDTAKLAEAAGTEGQLLLFKDLLSNELSQRRSKKRNFSSGKGFG